MDRGGKYRVQYLARVITEGDCTAPPAKIEAMYEPERFGLSASGRVDTVEKPEPPKKGEKKTAALSR